MNKSKPKPSSKLTEAARLELTYHLAANPNPEYATEAFMRWLVWCLQWRELGKQQAADIIDDSIQKLTELKQRLNEN